MGLRNVFSSEVGKNNFSEINEMNGFYNFLLCFVASSLNFQIKLLQTFPE